MTLHPTMDDIRSQSQAKVDDDPTFVLQDPSSFSERNRSFFCKAFSVDGFWDNRIVEEHSYNCMAQLAEFGQASVSFVSSQLDFKQSCIV